VHDESRQPASHTLGLAFRVRSRALLQRLHHHPKVMRPGCAPSHGIFPPFDVSSGRQRPTPGFHPRLRSAFRFSQPLDALLHPSPLRPCFVPVTSMGLASTAAFPRR
jgi:hypothetical protein